MTITIGIISVRGEDYPPTRRFIEAGRAKGHRVVVIHPYRVWPAVGGGPLSLVPAGGVQYDAVMPRQGAEVGDGCLPLVRHFMDTDAVVINDLDAITVCRNQFLALQRLVRSGVPVPHSVYINDMSGLDAACGALPGETVVVKPVVGRQGKGIVCMDRLAPKKHPVAGILKSGKGALLQAFIPPAGRRDIRVMVVGGRVLGAMELTPREGDFRANFHLSGKAEPLALEAHVADLAVTAAGAVGAEIAGVDAVITPEGRPLVLEVNYSPGFQGLEAATGIDVAGGILDYVAERVAGVGIA